MKNIILLILFSICLTGASDTDVVSSASTYYLSQTNIFVLSTNAKKGDSNAAFRLALYYRHSEPSHTNEIYWLTIAAKFGNVTAMDNSAFYCEYGSQPPKYGEVLRLYINAADLGDGFAMNELGRLYESGLGVKRSNAKAIRWYEKASRLGKVFSMEKNALLLEKEGEFQQAYIWAKVAERRCRRANAKGNEQISIDRILANIDKKTINALDKQIEKLDKEIPDFKDVSVW